MVVGEAQGGAGRDVAGNVGLAHIDRVGAVSGAETRGPGSIGAVGAVKAVREYGTGFCTGHRQCANVADVVRVVPSHAVAAVACQRHRGSCHHGIDMNRFRANSNNIEGRSPLANKRNSQRVVIRTAKCRRGNIRTPVPGGTTAVAVSEIAKRHVRSGCRVQHSSHVSPCISGQHRSFSAERAIDGDGSPGFGQVDGIVGTGHCADQHRCASTDEIPTGAVGDTGPGVAGLIKQGAG